MIKIINAADLNESKSIKESMVDLSKANDPETHSFSMATGDYVRLGEDDMDNEELAKQLKSQGYVIQHDTHFASGRDVLYVKEVEEVDESKSIKEVASIVKNESLTEDTFDYDENSERDQLIWDHLSTSFADKCLELIGIDPEKVPEQEWFKLIDLLVRIYKMTEE